MEHTKSLCIKFTYWVYFTLKIEFLIKCSLFQVQTRHFNDFELWPWRLTLKNLSKKLEIYFFEVLIQNWSRNTTSPTINMNFPRKLHKLPDYIVKTPRGLRYPLRSLLDMNTKDTRCVIYYNFDWMSHLLGCMFYYVYFSEVIFPASFRIRDFRHIYTNIWVKLHSGIHIWNYRFIM